MTTRTETVTKPGATGASPRATISDDTSRAAALAGTAASAAAGVKGVAADAAARLPEVAAGTRTAIEDANRQLRGGSDEMLTIGSALSFGLAGGLLLGGASRFIVAAALLPGAMMVLAMLDRSDRARQSVTRRLQDA